MTGEYTCVSPDRQNELTRAFSAGSDRRAGRTEKYELWSYRFQYPERQVRPPMWKAEWRP
jgi:hypothetical protein